MNKRYAAAKVTSVIAASALLTTCLPVPSAWTPTAEVAYAEEGNGRMNPDLNSYIAQKLNLDLLSSADPISGEKTDKSKDELALMMPSSKDEMRKTGHSLVVKQTLFDAATLGENEKIDDVFNTSEEHIGETLLGQFFDYTEVYDPGKEFSYYISFVDTGTMNGTYKVRDYDCGELDLSGTLIEEIHLDTDTGIIYIPKSLYKDENGNEYEHEMQMQMMCVYDFEADVSPKIDIIINNENRSVTAAYREQHIEANPLDMAFEVPIVTPETAGNITLGDLEIKINDEPIVLGKDSAEYNPETGMLVIGCGTSMASQIEVTIKDRGLFGTVDKAYAISGHSAMKAIKDYKTGKEAVLEHLDLSKVKVGAKFTYPSVIYYGTNTQASSHSKDPWKYWLGTHLRPYVYVGSGLWNAVNSGKVPTWSALRNPKANGMGDSQDNMNTAFDWPDRQRDLSNVPTTKDTPKFKSGSGRYMLGGLDWRGFPCTTVSSDRKNPYYRGVAQCAHIGSHGSAHYQGSYWVANMTMSVLAKGSDYIVVGFAEPTLNGQTGSSAYKIRVQSKGSVKIQKNIDNPNKVSVTGNDNYSLANAKYGVYKTSSDAKANRSRIATLKTNANGTSASVELDVGTYYIKEYKAPKGYILNNTVYKITIASGKDSTQIVKDQPAEAYAKVKKQSNGSTSFGGWRTYSLAGAVYTMYSDKACTKAITTFTTDANGNTAQSKALALGTYYIKETKASEGYILDPKVYTVKLTKDKQVFTVTSKETPVVSELGIRLVKRDKQRIDSNAGNDPQGGATLNATYTIKYFDEYLDSVAATAGKANKWSKDLTVSFNGTIAAAVPSTSQKFSNGSTYGWPLGTYLIEEKTAGAGYSKDENAPYLAQIKRNSGQNTAYTQILVGRTENASSNIITATNGALSPEPVHRGDVLIMKFAETTTDPDETPEVKPGVANIKFNIINKNKYSVQRVDTKQWVPFNGVVYTITTDQYGHATTKDIVNNLGDGKGALAYGTYQIQEVNPPEGYKPISESDVSVTENMGYYKYVIENFTGTRVRVTKIDKGTGKSISGVAKFRILDADKNPVVFKRYSPDYEEFTDFDTTADGFTNLPNKLMPGKYYLQEVAAPHGYLYSDELIPFECTSETVSRGQEIKVFKELGNDPAMGRVNISKKDSETGNLITNSPATFEIYAAEDIYTTDTDNARIDSEDGKNINGTLRVHKDELVDTITTDATGKAQSKDLYLGKYYAVEKVAPDLYQSQDEPVEFELVYENDRSPIVYTDIEFSDDFTFGSIDVVKKEFERFGGSPIAIAGAQFNIISKNDIIRGDGTRIYSAGEVVDTVETDATGHAETKSLPVGEYEIREIAAPKGYLLNDKPVSIEIPYVDQFTENETYDVELYDDIPYADTFMTKRDSETEESIKSPNTVIEIYAAEEITTPMGTHIYREDEIIDTISTDENGHAKTKAKLYPGLYYAKEKSAPTGYVLDSETRYPIEVEYVDQNTNIIHTELDIFNTAAKGTIVFNKVDAETGHLVYGVVKFQVYANEDITTLDGTTHYRKDELVGEFETDDSGYREVIDLPLGSYRVVEIEAPEGYLINDKPVNVELTYADQYTDVVSSTAKIADRPAYGVITVEKRDIETGETVKLEGTVFDIRAAEDIATPDGTVHHKAGELISSVATDSLGAGISENLYLGKYTVTESRAPYGYQIDPTPHEVELAYDGQFVPVVSATDTSNNEAQKGKISVTKTDCESGKPIIKPGATFEIRAAEDIYTGDEVLRAEKGEIVDTIVTDEDGIAQSNELYLGRYEVYETEAPEGYVLNENIYTVDLTYSGQDEPLVFEMISIEDQPVKGIMHIEKQDSDLKEALPDVEYEIRAAEDIVTGDGEVHYKEGDLIETIITGEDGTANSSEMYLGKYTITETKQPNGYELDEKSYPFELVYEGQDVPVVHEDMILYNTPTDVVVRKVSTENKEQVVPNTQFVGWEASRTIALDEQYAVAAMSGWSVDKASVEYLGTFRTVSDGTEEETRTFELSEKDMQQVPGENDANDVASEQDSDTGDIDSNEQEDDIERLGNIFTSSEPLVQGNHILHVDYTDPAGTAQHADIPFVVNEHDYSAYFYIGEDFRAVTDSSSFRSYNMLNKIAAVEDGDDEDVQTGEDNDINGKEVDNTPSEEVVAQFENDQTTDEIPPTADDATEDADGDDSDMPAGDDNENIPDENESAEQPDEPAAPVFSEAILRVPMIVEGGRYAYGVTDESGEIEFSYVPQGKILFAEFEAAPGFASDRNPGSAVVSEKGIVEQHEDNDRIDTNAGDGDKAIDFVFADEPLKLYVSKKDITNDEELPGNILSVYKAPDEAEKEQGIQYGEKIETWTSTDKPHYMELLPSGEYILKEESAVDGYTIAEEITFRLNDTGVEQQVTMRNEHEAGLADELVDTEGAPIIPTGDTFFPTLIIIVLASIVTCSAIVVKRRMRRRKM